MLLLYQVSRTNFSRLSAELGISHAIPMHHQVCRTYYTADFQQRRTSFHVMLLLQQELFSRLSGEVAICSPWGAGPRSEPWSCLTVDQHTSYATPYLSYAAP
jgi:hypothetical protein